MADRGQMDPNLVSPAGLEPAFQQACDPPVTFGRFGRAFWTSIPLQHLPMSNGLAPPLLDRHAAADGFMSIDRTIDVSSGCTRIVGERETTIPRAVTTWSTEIRPASAIIATTKLETIQVTPRAARGIGAFTMAVDGFWNSRIAGRVGSGP